MVLLAVGLRARSFVGYHVLQLRDRLLGRLATILRGLSLNRFHNSLPVIILQFKIERFLSSVLNCSFSRSHLVTPQRGDHPLKALVAHHLNFKTDKLDFLRVSEVAISLVNDAVTYSTLYSFQRFLLVHLRLYDNLFYEFTLKNQ